MNYVVFGFDDFKVTYDEQLKKLTGSSGWVVHHPEQDVYFVCDSQAKAQRIATFLNREQAIVLVNTDESELS